MFGQKKENLDCAKKQSQYRIQHHADLGKKKKLCCLFNITLRFLVPGWRLGWVLIYDKNEAFTSEVS